MIFSYNWLRSFFNKKLPKPEELAEILTMHSFEVEEVKKAGKDWLLDIDVLPNRGPDCLSHIGIAREIAAIIKLKVKSEKLKVKVKSSKLNIKDFLSIDVKEPSLCSRYTARVITDVKVGESPRWMQERLKICGLRPINNIVDATNYVMLETGQPLHAFDFDKVKSVEILNSKSQILNKFKIQNSKFQTKKIIIRKAKRGEKIITLDDEKYDLDKDILVIADLPAEALAKEGGEPLAIAGIKGGRKAEINNNTQTIILEAANFEMRTIRKARQKLKLQTEASLRFEHNLDPNLTEAAINRVAALIQEIAGGKVAQGLIDFDSKKVLPKKIKLDLSYAERLLGVKIPQKEIIKILKSLDFRIIQHPTSKIQHLIIETPTFRRDISIPEDLIEEIGRLYGYDKIKPVLPEAFLIPPKRNENIFWGDKIKNILKETGFTEVYNYSFINEKDISIYQPYRHKSAVIEIENPVSEEQQYLRPSLIPNLLKNVKDNLKYREEIKIFEIGKRFTKKQRIANNEQLEKTMLCGVIAKKSRVAKEEFYEAKGIVDLLLNQLGISDVWYDPSPPLTTFAKQKWWGVWEQKKCAEIKIHSKEIGFLGEISPRILEELKIEKRVVVFDIDFEELAKQCSEEQVYQPISKYPAIIRDLAILVPREVKVVEILNKINTAGGKLVRDVDLFDMYEGEELPDGKKNLAFHIIYQAENRTLTGKEVDKIQSKIIKILEEEPEWEIRR